MTYCDLEVLVSELLAVDGLAARAIAVGEVTWNGHVFEMELEEGGQKQNDCGASAGARMQTGGCAVGL